MYIIYPDVNGTSVVKPVEVAEVFVKHLKSLYNNYSLESYHSGILSIDVFAVASCFQIRHSEPVPEEDHCCMLLLLQKYGLIFVNSCNLEF